jgi:hypothetical protein
MLDSIWEFLKIHHKGVGIWGDSLSFIGGLMLAAEALFQKKDRLAIAVKGTVARLFPGAEDSEGNKVSTNATEEKQVDLWELVAKWGIVVLTVGFAFLLVSRISE